MESISQKKKFNVVNVYSAPRLGEKRQIWLKFGEIIKCCIGEPLCLVGDFNSVRSPQKRLDCEYRRKDSEGFDCFIKHNNLLDIPTVNGDYTWFGSYGKCSRLDRFLLNADWYEIGF